MAFRPSFSVGSPPQKNPSNERRPDLDTFGPDPFEQALDAKAEINDANRDADLDKVLEAAIASLTLALEILRRRQ